MGFREEIEAESDVWEFECIVREFEKEQDTQRKEELCKRAKELYQGEFLPRLSDEQWVIERNGNYQKQYSVMMKYLLRRLRDEGDHESVEKTAEQAARVCPDEEWKIWQLDSIVSLGRYKEAEALYQEMAAYMQKTGGILSKKNQAWLRKIGERINRADGSETDIRKCLMEETSAEGAYACTFMGFLDCFRMLKRTIAGGGVKYSLCLCIILDAGGKPAKGRQYCERQSGKLYESFRTCLKRGDIYTKYSDSQYLLLCIGADKKSIHELGERLDLDFRRRCGGRGGVRCTFLDDGDVW